MSNGDTPSVFISSTCYDLAQVRANLKDFVESLGYHPILSEYASFPVDPGTGTIDNCLKVVEEQADIFVLIVGGRYGTQSETGKSVTNLEYLRSHAKGIPAYVFAQKSILDALSLWKDNPDANFSKLVDSQKVFEFLETLLSTENVWVFPFETAQEIADTLRIQFSYLFSSLLALRLQVRYSNLPAAIGNLKGKPLQLILEKPDFWEHLLFGTALVGGIKACEDLKLDLRHGIALGSGEYFSDIIELKSWIRSQLNELQRISHGLNQLLNVAFVEAIGPPGLPGDPVNILYVADRVSAFYRSGVEWTLRVRRVLVEDDWLALINGMASFTENMLCEIEEWSDSLTVGIEEGLIESRRGQYSEENPFTLDLTLTLSAPSSVDDFCEELDSLERRHSFD